MNEQPPSRFGELVAELMGAQAFNKLMLEIWEAADFEKKQALANGVVASLLEQRRIHALVFDKIDQYASKIVDEAVSKLLPDITRIVNEHADIRVKELAEEKAKRLLKQLENQR